MTGFGYLPFDFGFDADHQGMFVDIWRKDENMARIPVRRRCKLKSKNPKPMNKYLSIVRKTTKSHNIEARLAKLEGKETLTE